MSKQFLKLLTIFALFAVVFLPGQVQAELLPLDDGGSVIQVLAPGTTQKITYTATEGETAAWGETSGNVTIRVVCTTNCHILCAAAPTVDTSDPFLPALTVEYWKVSATDVCAVLRATADGTAFFTEMQ